MECHTYNVHTYAGLALNGVNLVRYDNAVHLGHDVGYLARIAQATMVVLYGI